MKAPLPQFGSVRSNAAARPAETASLDSVGTNQSPVGQLEERRLVVFGKLREAAVLRFDAMAVP